MKQFILDSRNKIKDEMPRQIARWVGTSSEAGNAIQSYEVWLNNGVWLDYSVENRAIVLFEDLKQFGYDKTSSLSVFITPRGAGKVLFNDLTLPENSWRGQYLNNLDINLNATSNSGYIFKGWAEIRRSHISKKVTGSIMT